MTGQVPDGYEDAKESMQSNPPSPLACEKPKKQKKANDGQLLREQLHI